MITDQPRPKRRYNIPVLGDGAIRIGMLYDGTLDQPIIGQNLFRKPIIENKKVTSTDYQVIAESKISERLDHLDIKGSISVSFLAGLLEVSNDIYISRFPPFFQIGIVFSLWLSARTILAKQNGFF